MFLTWSGYEIDGSDTNFDLILPESEQALDLVEYLVRLPIFDQNKLQFYDDNHKELSWEAFKEKLLTRSFERLSVVGSFKAFDLLDEKTRRDFRRISQKRQPPEAAFKNAQNPASAPTYYAGTMEFFIVCNAKHMEDRYSSCDWLRGYEKNTPLFLDDFSQAMAFELWVPVVSIYEYFIYLMDQLTERFPSLATSGGLDCGGGWTEGCTYGDSLYRYEKVQIPLQYGVKHFLKKMVSHGITSYTGRFYNTTRKRIFDFALVNNEEGQKPLKFGEYIEYVEEQLEHAKNDFDAICRTAIWMWIPSPDEFKSDTILYEAMLPLASKMTKYSDTVNLSFYKNEGAYFAEFRVSPVVKDYFLSYLDLVERDAFADVKEKMYDQRQKFERNRAHAYQIIRKKKGSRKQ